MRLTNQIKDIIIENAVKKSGLLDKQADIRVKFAEWVEKVRIDALGGKENADNVDGLIVEMKHLSDQLPKSVQKENMCRFDNNIYVNVAGKGLYMRFNGMKRYTDDVIQIYKPTPNSHTLIGDSPLAIEFDEIDGMDRDNQNAIRDLRIQIKGTLSNFSTDKTLLKVWPEAVELLPNYVPETKSQLPAVRTEELNKLIGLPTVKDSK